MTSVVKRVTSNFSLIVPFFDAPNWGFAFERNMDIIDAVLSTTSSVGNIVGPWESNTAYGVDDRVVDMTNNTVWQCAVAHTSGSGTFAQDRIAHPTYWDAVSQSVVVREEFVDSRDYFVGDFVYDTSEFLGGIVTSPFTGNVNLRNNINDIGVIFDLKALYGMFPSTPSDGDYIQWNNTLGIYEPRDSDYVRDEMKAVTYNSGQSLSSGEQTQARTNISAADVTTVVRHDVAQALGASAQGQARANIRAEVLSGFRNKIINGDFVVNQRGGTRTPGVGVYGYDRWKGHANGLEQVIEALEPGQYTLTWGGGGNGTFAGITGPSPLKASSSGGNAPVVVPSTATRVSLVPGDATTEADPFSPRHIQQELALCQRYYEVICSSMFAAVSGNSISIETVAYMRPKLVSPSVTRLGDWQSSAEAGTRVGTIRNDCFIVFKNSGDANPTVIGGRYACESEF